MPLPNDEFRKLLTGAFAYHAHVLALHIKDNLLSKEQLQYLKKGVRLLKEELILR